MAGFTEPPITMPFTSMQLTTSVRKKIKLPIAHFPNNTQAVERTVKLVTEPPCKVIGHEKRHEYMLNVLKSRAANPSGAKKTGFLEANEVNCN